MANLSGSACVWYGFAYSATLVVLSLVMAGGGHGPLFPLELSLFGLIMGPASGAALTVRKNRRGRFLFPTLMVINLAVWMATLRARGNAEADYLARVSQLSPLIAIAFVTVFAVGQLGFWFLDFAKRRELDTSRKNLFQSDLFTFLFLIIYCGQLLYVTGVLAMLFLTSHRLG